MPATPSEYISLPQRSQTKRLWDLLRSSYSGSSTRPSTEMSNERTRMPFELYDVQEEEDVEMSSPVPLQSQLSSIIPPFDSTALVLGGMIATPSKHKRKPSSAYSSSSRTSASIPSSVSTLSISTISTISTVSSLSPPLPLNDTLLRECFPRDDQEELRSILKDVVQSIDASQPVSPERLLQFLHPHEEPSGIIAFDCLFWAGDKPCGRSFARKDRAIDHIWGHLGYRPYPCRGCDMSSCQASFYSRGDRHAHEQKRKEVCEHCGRTVSVKNRSRHRRSGSCMKPPDAG